MAGPFWRPEEPAEWLGEGRGGRSRQTSKSNPAVPGQSHRPRSIFMAAQETDIANAALYPRTARMIGLVWSDLICQAQRSRSSRSRPAELPCAASFDPGAGQGYGHECAPDYTGGSREACHNRNTHPM